MATHNNLDLGTYRGAAAGETGTGGQASTAGEIRLDWRRDPGESFSDFKIIVVKVGEGMDNEVDEDTAKRPRIDREDDQENGVEEEVTYYVHKCVIRIGKSEYFSTLFRTKIGNHRGERDCSRVELDQFSAGVFPMMLDHLYGISERCAATRSNAVSLRSLADRFGIPDLHKVATEYIRNDLSINTAATYLLQSSFHRDAKLLDTMVVVCAENFEKLTREDIENLHSDHFQRMVSSPRLHCSSEILSRQVAAFLKSHRNGAEALLVRSLTRGEKMPSIDPKVASIFLNLDSRCPSEDKNDRGPTLKKRSIDALSENFGPWLNEADDFWRLTSRQKLEVALAAKFSADRKIEELESSITGIICFLACDVENGGKYINKLLSSEACTREALFSRPPDFGYIQLNRDNYPDVIVSGAGISVANGTYTLHDSHDGVGAYKHGNFYLFRGSVENGKEWQINFCHSLPLYYVKIRSRPPEDCDQPLGYGWQTPQEIGGPVPRLKLA